MHFDLPFLNAILIGFLSLFPAVNPVGSAFIVDPLLGDLSFPERKNAAKKVALYCLATCAVSALIGSWILRLFGLSIPIVQLAGGIMICRMGWVLLTSDDEAKKDKEKAQPTGQRDSIDDILFYPIAFPMTTGAGTISVILTLSAHEDRNLLAHFLNLGALLVAILLICILIYFCYANTARIIHRLGRRGEQIVNRLSAFLVFCIGMQIGWAGISALMKS